MVRGRWLCTAALFSLPVTRDVEVTATQWDRESVNRPFFLFHLARSALFLSSNANGMPPLVRCCGFSQCPMCRAACHVTAGDAGTNVTLVNIILSRFRREYAARAREVRELYDSTHMFGFPV